MSNQSNRPPTALERLDAEFSSIISKDSLSPLPAPRFISLLSTGLDSPIATFLMMRQGLDPITLSFLNGQAQAGENQEKILQIGQKLVELTGRRMIMLFVDYDRFLERFQHTSETRLTCILCKRTMMDMAKTLAQRYQAKYIVNGDILGEQASQTLDNLFVVHQINREIPVVRPLIGFDKLDVIKLSQNIGLFELSLLKGPACEFNPPFPETRAKIDQVRKIEAEIDRAGLREEILSQITLKIIEPVTSKN
ncbi:MAG: hypothetical protein E4G98_06520 [Promethearchaeota archaeon]|nr:MAG: hypothetical protein E4G98_06520 [Candidatus Lokiarchaeota archaeon]